METATLINAEFWHDFQCQVMVNDRDTSAVDEAVRIRAWVKHQEKLSGHLLFATSGSTGARKCVALSRAALLASANMLNAHLDVDSSDRWLLALPTFHVGGLGILARCQVAGCDVVSYREKWDAREYHALCCKQKITLSSMVPTQLVDLVRGGLRAPSTMRVVLIGGGRLDDAVYEQAVSLGWPVVETYGMTETCSQVATARLGSRTLELLPSWRAKTDVSGRLMLKGDSVLTGYVQYGDDGIILTDPKEDGWFLTGDVVDVNYQTLTVNGRSDRCVKILGELVNMDEVEREVDQFMPDETSGSVIVALDDLRKGSRLILCVKKSSIPESIVSSFNRQCHPLHRIDSVQVIPSFPRSPLGKIRYSELTQITSCLKSSSP